MDAQLTPTLQQTTQALDIQLIEELKTLIKGDVVTDIDTLNHFSHDTSLFEVKPQIVVFPKDDEDVKKLIEFVNKYKKKYPNLSLTGRSAGTDMSGGSINDSILVVFQKYFTNLKEIKDNEATVQPGMFYRDFEKATLQHGLLFPSYPASREICAIGGIVNNNSGGEKSLCYGKTENFVRRLKAVFSDGNRYEIKPLTETEVKRKMLKKDFEGEVYRKMYHLITKNYDLLQEAKPKVSKNSAGYYLWNVYNKEKKIFDLTKLIVGAQGTLCLITEVTLGLMPVKPYSEMMIIFLNDLKHLGEIINAVLPLKPETFETYDDHTLNLAMKFFPEFAAKLGTKNFISTGFQFLPEVLMMVTGGKPKLILQVEFEDTNPDIINDKLDKLQEALKPFGVRTRIAGSIKAEQKYWLIRRESFNLLRQKIRNKHTAPFIDDFAVRPEYLPEFLPKLNALFTKYPHLIYTVAGHVGDGNFHIIPLMNIEDPKQREIIPVLGKEVYDLVIQYKGTITAEHNDGLIRTPYLHQMYGDKVYKLFEETKNIFDPHHIFNPRKKVFGDLDFAMSHVRTSW